MDSSVNTILLYTIAAGFIAIIYGYFTGKQISLTFILAPLVLPEIIVGVALLIVLIQLGRLFFMSFIDFF